MPTPRRAGIIGSRRNIAAPAPRAATSPTRSPRRRCAGAAEEETMNDAIERALGAIQFGPDGLVPAIAQQHDSGEVLMTAWMNRDSVRLSLAEGRAVYWSRSRQALWRKGE